MERIVITGMGAVTPLGIGVNNYWSSLIAGKSGVDFIRAFNTENLATKFSGEVEEFNPSDYLPKDLIKNTEKFMQFAYIAADEAIKQSGIEFNPHRTGITLGTAMGGVTPIAETQEKLTLNPGRKISPRFIPKLLGNIAASNIAIYNKIYGPSLTISTACASGGDAINAACMFMRSGETDVMVVIGAETTESPLVINALTTVKALSKRNDSPSSASRPFDITRDGFVIGEGGGALVLETESHALARGAKILGEVKACASTNDAYHAMAPHPEGRGAVDCMKRALSKVGLLPSDINYINAHGTSTPKGDTVEANAIKTLFEDKIPFVSSTKGATGHMMGAGGITEAIACVKAIETGVMPPTINLNEVDPECSGIDFIPNTAKTADVKYAMSNAFGFGGQNSSIIIGRYE